MNRSVALLFACVMACGCSGFSRLELVDARVDQQKMALKTSGLSAEAGDEALDIQCVFQPAGLMVSLKLKSGKEGALDWEKSRFVWPDGGDEPILGAAPAFGAGRVGAREPTKLAPGQPVPLAIAPQSRAGRLLLDSDDLEDMPDNPCLLRLAVQVDGKDRVYELTLDPQ
jgi:hypothetical protein